MVASVTELRLDRPVVHPDGCRCLRCEIDPLLSELERRTSAAVSAGGPRLVPVWSKKARDQRPTPVATELLGVGKDLVYRLINRGDIETVWIDSRQMVVVESIDKYVARLRGQM